MRNRGKRIIERTAEMFSLPGDAIGMSRLVATGNNKLLIENHKGVAEYSCEHISINCGSIMLGITGSNLEICAMNRHEIVVGGDIEKLEFLK